MTTFVMNEKTHEKFLENLERSKEGVLWVYNWLRSQGYKVEILESTKAKNPGERFKHQDNGDLQMLWKGVERRVEVKWLRVNFTGSADWPFRRKTGKEFMVCAKHSYDGAAEKPLMYIILSADCRGLAVVMGETYKTWWSDLNDGGKDYEGYVQTFYYCPMEEVFWLKEVAMPENAKLKPGSDEALDAGCKCPVIDNGHGKGAMGGSILGDTGEPLFWMNEACPIHGKANDEEQPAAN